MSNKKLYLVENIDFWLKIYTFPNSIITYGSVDKDHLYILKKYIEEDIYIGKDKEGKPINDIECWLYTLFSEEETPYVGITDNIYRRFTEHRRDKNWDRAYFCFSDSYGKKTAINNQTAFINFYHRCHRDITCCVRPFILFCGRGR